MSVKKHQRTPAKPHLKVADDAIAIRHMLNEFGMRDYGMKQPKGWRLRPQYRRGYNIDNRIWKEKNLLEKQFNQIDYYSVMVSASIGMANRIHPTNLRELEERRQHQTDAIAYCGNVIDALQEIMSIFDVDINKFKEPTQALQEEVRLLKKWRQSDNSRYRSRFKKNGTL